MRALSWRETLLGNVLVGMLAVTEDLVRRARALQQDGDGRDIGTILADLGYCQLEDVAIAAELQREMREGDVLTAMRGQLAEAYGRMRATVEDTHAMVIE